MKRLFIIIFIISCCLNINAQESAKSLTIGNQWYYSIIPEVVVGDTIIQGNQYSVIDLNTYPYIRYERSDSSAVYEYNVGLEQGFVVYDFSWELNNSYFANNCYIYVSDKGTALFLNTLHEFIIIVQDEGSWFEERTYCRKEKVFLYGSARPTTSRRAIDGLETFLPILPRPHHHPYAPFFST